jgi:3-deoxy-manno-octulosonate cytidylyltransferase (CMP-KDO synthetase)
MAQATAIIPARLESTRFPRKVLANDTGKPMIIHTCDAAHAASVVRRVVVATDSQEILDTVRKHGYEGVQTSADHENGTSRIAQAAELMGLAADSIVVNPQADEPELEPGLIDAVIGELIRTKAPMATAASPMTPGDDPDDPNLVKVVVGIDGRALYFSRANIPFNRDGDADAPARPLKHIGLYVYRRAFLDEFLALPPTPLERTEKLEQLRAIEHRRTIVVAIRETATRGVDTPADYAGFVERFRSRRTV